MQFLEYHRGFELRVQLRESPNLFFLHSNLLTYCADISLMNFCTEKRCLTRLNLTQEKEAVHLLDSLMDEDKE